MSLSENIRTSATIGQHRYWDLNAIVAGLRAQRERWRQQHNRDPEFGGRELPSREALRDIATALCGALFPMRLGPLDLRQETEDFYIGHTLDTALHSLLEQVGLELRYESRSNPGTDGEIDSHAIEIVRRFANELTAIRGRLDTDIQAAYRGDPAARSVDEVLLCYPGIFAITHHRIAHTLYRLGTPLLARIIAERAHAETGIDIHPGAEIGDGFFIDHGTGVVIGETAEIGEHVKLYQGVALIARSLAGGQALHGVKRHPTVEERVTVYSGTTIMGGDTIIGAGSTIGANVFLTHSIPPRSLVFYEEKQLKILDKNKRGVVVEEDWMI